MAGRRFRFACPYCGGIFFTLTGVAMTRRRSRLPCITAMTCAMTCDECGLMTDYLDFVRMHRGWL